jgi:T1SS-143 domain-containing protein
VVILFADGSQIVLEGLAELADAGQAPDITAGSADLLALLSGAEGLAAVLIETPGPGETVEISLLAGQRYIFDFAPEDAQILVVDGDLVLVFANGGRIVFDNMPDIATATFPPIFAIAGLDFPAGLLYDLAVAEFGGTETPFARVIETAAPEILLGSGNNVFGLPSGQPIDLLAGEPVIPPRALEFGLIELQGDFIPFDEELPNSPPLADGVLTTADFEPVPDELIDILNSFTSLPPGPQLTALPEIVFFKQFTVNGLIGDDDSVLASFGGSDAETALGDLIFTLTSEPQYGTIYLVDGTTGDVTIATAGTTFGSGDILWFVATVDEVNDFLMASGLTVVPDVSFTYIVSDADLNSADATVTIDLPQADVVFGITVTSEDTNDDSPTQFARIEEDNNSNDSATFTIAIGGDLLATGNVASVKVGVSGTATDGVDYTAAIFAAIQAVADVTGGVTFNSATGVLTFDSTAPSEISFTITAFDDNLVELTEDVIVTLSNPTILFGTAALASGEESAEVEILSANTPPLADDVVAPAEQDNLPQELVDLINELFTEFFPDVVFWRVGTVDGAIGDDDTEDSTLGGFDAETPLEALVFTITSLPNYGTLYIVSVDENGDVVSRAEAAVGSTFDSNDRVWYIATVEDVQQTEGLPDVFFTYSVTDEDGETADGTVTLLVPDPAVSFGITVTSEATGNDSPTQSATILEDGGADDEATFTISLGGDLLTLANFAFVTVSVSGSAGDGTDYTPTVFAAIQAVADATAGVSFDSSTGVLTFESDAPSEISFTITAFDDSLIEGVENVVVTLSDPTILIGSAGVNPGQGSAEVDIISEDVDFNPTAGDSTAEVDEDDLPGGIEGGVGDIDSGAGTVLATFSGTLNYDFGGDGPGDVDFASLGGLAVQATGDLGLQALTSSGDTITFVWNGATHTLSGIADLGGGSERPVFTVEITNVTTGDYTFTLLDQVDHPTANTEDDFILSLSFTVSDSDGDTATGTLTVTIDDDTPTVAPEETENGTVFENELATVLSTGTDQAGITGDDDNGDGNNDDTVVTGSLAALVNFGADESGTFDLLVIENTTPVASGLQSQGEDVFYVSDGTTLTAFVDSGTTANEFDAGDRVVFTLALSGTNNETYTFTLFDQLDHLPTVQGEETLLLDFSSVVVATDADGDALALPGESFTISVIDDVPAITAIENAILANEVATITGNIDSGLGADEPGTFTITDFTDLDGVSETLSPDGTMLIATIDGTGDPLDPSDDTVFYTLTVNPDSTYTFDLVTPRPAFAEIILEEQFAAGPFVEILEVTATGGTMVTFDGLTFTDGGTVANPINDPTVGPGSDDDLGPNGVGFGLRGGQSQNINDNQGFEASFSTDLSSFTFFIDQQGNTSQTTITWQAFNDGLLVAEDLSGTVLALPSGPNLVSFTINFGGDFDEVVIRFDHPEQNDSVRIQDFSFTRQLLPEDQALAFDVAVTDSDGDSATLLIADFDGDSDPDSFQIDLLGGDPADPVIIVGTATDEVIRGQTGTSDTLTGGGGDDDFVLTDLIAADVITDYNAGDEIDLVELLDVNLTQTDVEAVVTYDSTTGDLQVDAGGGFQSVAAINADGGGFPPSVEVIVDDGLGNEQTFTIM